MEKFRAIERAQLIIDYWGGIMDYEELGFCVTMVLIRLLLKPLATCSWVWQVAA